MLDGGYWVGECSADIHCEITTRPVLRTGVGGGGAGGAIGPTKVLIWGKSGQNPIESGQNPLKFGKISENLLRLPVNLKKKWRPTCFDLKIMTLELT